MRLIRNFKIATNIFKTHRTRTFLSVLGIVIGIMAVISIINAGSSLKQFILAQVEVFGTDYIEVEIKVPNTSQTSADNTGGLAQGVLITTLKSDDAKQIKKHPNVSEVYAGVLGQEIITYEGINQVGLLWGVSEGFFSIDKGNIEAGRAFSNEEDKSLSQVVVLGSKIKEDLFGQDSAIGKKIKINKRKFKVIGVRESVGGGAFMDLDDMIIMPLNTIQKKVLGINYVSFIMASIKDMSIVDQTTEDITNTMRQLHDITDPAKEDFAVISSKEAFAIMDTIFNALTIFLVAIAAISLIVGGVGVMNIMYVSVLERTYEIGLKKAVGATNSDIMQQFLGEAILITSLGGIIGIILGILVTLLISLVASAQGFEIKFIVSLTGILVSTIFMIVTGLIFGIYPAKRAADLNPVEALHYE